MYNNGYDRYRENSINMASPEELTLMLYNGLIKFLMQADMGLEEKSLEKTNNSIIRAQEIIQEFQVTLDKKYPIAESLNAIYDYLYRRLVEANIKKDREILAEVLDLTKELRDTWAQAMKLSKQQSAADKQARAVGES